MTKKTKQSKKSTKNSKRTKLAAKPEDETATAAISEVAEAPESPTIQEAEVTVEPQQATEAAPLATPVLVSETAAKATRSETVKANIKEGLKQHAIAGRPTKEQLILVFGQKGYALTWTQTWFHPNAMESSSILQERIVSRRCARQLCGFFIAATTTMPRISREYQNPRAIFQGRRRSHAQ